jgi:hypothetical protein
MTRKNIIARMVSSNNKIVSSRFFEQSQFEQFTMSQNHVKRFNIRIRIMLKRFNIQIRIMLKGLIFKYESCSKVCDKGKCILPPSCKQDLDCSKDRICENGVCANIECKSDRYCPSRAKCNDTARICRSKRNKQICCPNPFNVIR